MLPDKVNLKEFIITKPLLYEMLQCFLDEIFLSKNKIKTPEKEVRDKEIVNLSDAVFETLVIRMLTEMTEYWRKMQEEVKAMQSEIKKNIQGTNSKMKETGTQINDLDQKGEINIQLEQNE